MKTKVKALTLSEMVIVMIITTIVVGLAFTVLSLVQRHMWAIQQNFKVNTEFNRLEQALWIDSHQFSIINFNDIENRLNFKTAIDSINYKFYNDYVLRDRDTFHLKLGEKMFYFDGEEINKGKVDALKIELETKQKDLSVFIYKRNDAAQFID